jgi:uncharacterized membrane protein YgdD (TMEM256/DUF423 family)
MPFPLLSEEGWLRSRRGGARRLMNPFACVATWTADLTNLKITCSIESSLEPLHGPIVARLDKLLTMAALPKLFLVLGALAAALAVVLGAFGAHALRARLAPDLLAIYHTAVQYHFWHALGLLAIGIVAIHLPSSVALKWAGWVMLAGIVAFSGSLYVLALTGVRWLGAITPFGGAAFIVSWILLAVAVVRAG